MSARMRVWARTRVYGARIRVYASVHVYVRVRVHVCFPTWASVRAWACVRKHFHMRIHTRTHMCVRVRVPASWRMCMCALSYALSCVCARFCASVRVWVGTDVHLRYERPWGVRVGVLVEMHAGGWGGVENGMDIIREKNTHTLKICATSSTPAHPPSLAPLLFLFLFLLFFLHSVWSALTFIDFSNTVMGSSSAINYETRVSMCCMSLGTRATCILYNVYCIIYDIYIYIILYIMLYYIYYIIYNVLYIIIYYIIYHTLHNITYKKFQI